MSITPDLTAEMRILMLYNLDSIMEGLKVHQTADSETKQAIERLFAKGLVNQPDGGYLTELGIHCAEHLQAALRILDHSKETA
ncbi:TIGR02647 family protein [Rheinheimera sp. MMS21-TC3]|uniref:TIGR02647 family protein n=1 Tax=Rheinheimera sp. MMS21-TC3 TaxID=3072790 RepID=UPI0028C4DEE6|nr:TIGR02647 family protein [Rheinheimera sp. MMS21-TC3]WNO61128.1 TIGR02647 family protein [Rheinheimera sp. MMS21-TC3]